MDQLRLTAALANGADGPEVKLLQEWLNLRGFRLNVTSAFGAPTEAAVLDFCASQGLPPQTVIDNVLFVRLIEPLLAAVAPTTASNVRHAVLAMAEQQLAQSPRAVGRLNAGPWVRLYLDGKEGPGWCSGFVSFCLRRGCESLRVPMPFGPASSLEQLVEAATRAGRRLARPSEAVEGDLFVVRAPTGECTHGGVVRSVSLSTFESIEGNEALQSPDGAAGRMAQLGDELLVTRRREFAGCEFLKTGN